MSISRRLILGTALGLALTAALSGCAKSGSDAQTVVVSFSDLSQPFFVAMRADLEDEAKKLGVKVQVLDGQNNSSKQVADVQAAEVQGVGAVILAPTDSKALASTTDELIQQGIVVATVDRHIEGGKQTVPHFGADNVAGGRLMGDWVVKTFPKGARVVVITNDPGSSTSIERVQGVHEALAAGGPAFKILTEQTAYSKRDQALTVTQNILTSMGGDHPDAILCLNDDMAMGALEAVRGAGLSPQQVRVLGFDAIPEALAKVRDGEMAATVEQNPGKQIRLALDSVVAALRDHKPLTSHAIEPVLITKDNLNQAARISEVR
ncbi:MAG: substrate-binding domain-containing protein [Asticcacaulis sp.]|uniref:substrate-binding domain-containing protein n=1 Tax=Asticcacaulis sp. TaxID=1872648 RepID=UPI003F7CD2F9